MSDSKQGGGEPSMEEILASIRKIISEDTADDRAGSTQHGAEADDSAPQADDQGDDVLELDDAADPISADPSDTDPGAADDGDDAPLDLTEEVAAAGDDTNPDDAAPLDLDEQVDAETAGAAQADAEYVSNDDIGDFDEIAQAAETVRDDIASDDRAAGDSATGDLAEEDTAGGAAAVDSDAADETAFLADPFDGTQAGTDAPDTAAEAALAAGAMAGARGGEAQGRDATTSRSDDTASPLGPDDQRVISDTAEQQAVEQLTSLARQADDAPSGTAADNVDHILARMVRDALRPQLREWMDRNLPQIVERIVREEVQRMTKRAQGLDDDTRY
ncbi:hypothetical protein CKO28_09850 [Rhodovibrio sodomensis]|uniref:DUF2497 domain-containing protein n=1 Tax=Rhodovibrio sodomensis TaxID=1088 RepID=A0ABS1DEE4_9PROT|nr:DUF2497 domain-containing protein [Rhodovibrio sodomensis]MBK1668336.1 hypothetical protein [Rhodovibrio sodomensis]